MNYCHYTLKANGQEFTSYSELLDYLDEVFSNKNELKQLDKITDIVFSRADRQASQIDKLNSIKVEGLTKLGIYDRWRAFIRLVKTKCVKFP